MTDDTVTDCQSKDIILYEKMTCETKEQPTQSVQTKNVDRGYAGCQKVPVHCTDSAFFPGTKLS